MGRCGSLQASGSTERVLKYPETTRFRPDSVSHSSDQKFLSAKDFLSACPVTSSPAGGVPGYSDRAAGAFAGAGSGAFTFTDNPKAVITRQV